MCKLIRQSKKVGEKRKEKGRKTHQFPQNTRCMVSISFLSDPRETYCVVFFSWESGVSVFRFMMPYGHFYLSFLFFPPLGPKACAEDKPDFFSLFLSLPLFYCEIEGAKVFFLFFLSPSTFSSPSSSFLSPFYLLTNLCICPVRCKSYA